MIENKLIWVATIVSIVTYQFWSFLPSGSFYIGMSIFVFILSIIIYLKNRHLFVSFLLICLSTNNLLDELFFDPKTNGINEFFALIIIPILYYARKNIKQ